MDLPAIDPRNASVAIVGSGGSGALTTGQILLTAAARTGLYGLLSRSTGPQIRGGESAAMLRFADRPVGCLGDRFDILVGLDWNAVDRFVDEIPLNDRSLIVADAQGPGVPEILTCGGAQVQTLPFTEIARTEPQGRLNMVALGVLGALLGLPLDALAAGARETLGNRALGSTIACLGAGYRCAAPENGSDSIAAVPSPAKPDERWLISGNEAAGLGALRGGVRFVAAYPITPASEMLEWLAPRLELVGGSLLQAEDELASVNMIVGASFGGVPSLTATSGPGLSLMMEGLGLAVASETPIVVADVQRGGPSTGIPSKSEQSDLDIAIYGLHGDAPHLVIAPLSIPDCAFAFQWAVRLAEHLQTVAIVLSDQQLGQSRAVCDPPRAFEGALARRVEPHPVDGYRRYALTEDGISPMTLPGTPNGMYTADGLEHNVKGTPSSMAGVHAEQLGKRLKKVAEFDYGADWGEVRWEGRTCLLAWGSSAGAVFEAAERLNAAGRPTRAVALRLLAPLPRASLATALAGADRILVVEQNQSGQLFRYLHSERVLPAAARSFARPGPLPLRPAEIVRFVEEGL